jgi:hypothetical protein
MLGRLLFLLIPTVLIFFSGPIFALVRQIGRTQAAREARPGGAKGAASR